MRGLDVRQMEEKDMLSTRDGEEKVLSCQRSVFSRNRGAREVR